MGYSSVYNNTRFEGRLGTTMPRAKNVKPEKAHGFPWTNIAVYALLYVLCQIAYLGITDNYLFNDDFLWLSEARYGMEWGTVLTYRVIDFFRPLINFSFLVMDRIAPGNIALHYSFNLILHFINTVLVFHFISLLLGSKKTAAAAAVIFAVSSVHTGAVLWISARTTLISTMLVLGSLIAFTARTGSKRSRVILSTALFILALAAKETAIAGLVLLVIAFLFVRSRDRKQSYSPLMLVPPTLVSFLYLVIRKAVMGGFVQQNWGPGWHVLRNIAGGFLYSVYPWPFTSLFYQRGGSIPEPVHPIMPEIIVVPLILLLVWVGRSTRKGGEFNLAISWSLLSLVPASLFRYRFFSTVSITQNRYYYLSSVGSILLITLLLSLLWHRRSRPRQLTAAVLFLVICTGYMVKVHRIEKKWDEFTNQNRTVVETLIEEADNYPAISTLAIEDSPFPLRYLASGIKLTRPQWKLVEITGGREAALDYKPCLYVFYYGDKMKVMRVEKIE